MLLWYYKTIDIVYYYYLTKYYTIFYVFIAIGTVI